MHVILNSEGGFAFIPGIRRTFEVETSQLPAERAAHLKHLVKAAHFFDLPPRMDSVPKGAADYLRFKLTIQDGERKHAIHTTELVEHRELAALLEAIRQLTLDESVPLSGE